MRIRFKVFTIFIAVFLISNNTAAQTESSATFFVSRFQASVENNAVKLSWKDSSDVVGGYAIYRYTEEIKKDNITKAEQIAQIESGKEYYIDHPPSGTGFYYLILGLDSDKKPYEFYIPFRNKSISAVTTGSIQTTAAANEKTAAAITGIKAGVENESISLSFNLSDTDAESKLVIYRSTSVILSKENLLAASLIATISGEKSSYTDYPVQGVPYYYGVFNYSLLMVGIYTFSKDENITTTSVQIPLSSEQIETAENSNSRSRPLPFLLIPTSIQTGGDLTSPLAFSLPEKKEISKHLSEAVSSILSIVTETEYKEINPVILPKDRISSESNEDYKLNLILSNEFLDKDWEGAEKLFLDFLGIHHSKEIESRAHFYLAQVYYFQEKYSKAFMEFLLTESDYYKEIQPWLDILYIKLRENNA